MHMHMHMHIHIHLLQRSARMVGTVRNKFVRFQHNVMICTHTTKHCNCTTHEDYKKTISMQQRMQSEESAIKPLYHLRHRRMLAIKSQQEPRYDWSIPVLVTTGGMVFRKPLID